MQVTLECPEARATLAIMTPSLPLPERAQAARERITDILRSPGGRTLPQADRYLLISVELFLEELAEVAGEAPARPLAGWRPLRAAIRMAWRRLRPAREGRR